MSKYNYYDRTLYGSVLSRILNVNTTQRSPFAQDKLTLMARSKGADIFERTGRMVRLER